MPYIVRLGPQPEGYVQRELDVIHPGTKQFFRHLVSSIEEGVIDLERQSEHAQSLLRRVQAATPEELQVTATQRQAITADLEKTIATAPEAWVCWVEARPPSAPKLFFSMYFEVRPPAPGDKAPEIFVFKLTVHAC